MTEEAARSDATPAGATASGPASVAGTRLRARCWGTRGSIPSPGHATAHFGGNTPCLELRTDDDRCFVFDAGTGIRPLGQRLQGTGGRVDLCLTHFHWDHVQGIPFFAPLYDPETDVCIHGARQGDRTLESVFRSQFEPIHFPIPFEALRAKVRFRHLEEGPWEEGGLRIDAMRVRHPANTYGYRIRAGRASIAYIPDNELIGSDYPVESGWYDRLVEFLGDVDLVFHDAMYTEQEYATREGWGHSTFTQAVELARRAGVRRLQFFHHAPDRTDAELLDVVSDVVERTLGSADALDVGIATEGDELLVQEQSGPPGA